MESNKQYPIKILDNLYVFGIANSPENEKEEFFKLSEVDRIELLIMNKPSVKQAKSKLNEKRCYTPSFGNFIISTLENKPIQFYDLYFTQKKSEELFLKVKEAYNKMNDFSNQMKEFVYAKKDWIS